MSNRWLTSDLHIGHELVAKLRGYDDPLEHDIEIAQVWRKFIHADDVVWILGDISSGGTAAQREALIFLSELPGRKILVAGNHDGPHPCHGSASRRWDAEYREVFDYVCSQACMTVAKQKVMLSHFPYEADHTEKARYAEWRLPDVGLWLAHGHTHDSVPWRPERPREFHVGWDAHKAPVSMGMLHRYIMEGIKVDSDSSGQDRELRLP